VPWYLTTHVRVCASHNVIVVPPIKTFVSSISEGDKEERYKYINIFMYACVWRWE
jgi:hypothetical protein